MPSTVNFASTPSAVNGVTVLFGRLNIQVTQSETRRDAPTSAPAVDCDERVCNKDVTAVGCARCWNCTLMVASPYSRYFVMPTSFNIVTKEWRGRGQFCCWECVKRFTVSSGDGFSNGKQCVLLTRYLKELYGYTSQLAKAPGRYELDAFGGRLSEAELVARRCDRRNADQPLKAIKYLESGAFVLI